MIPYEPAGDGHLSAGNQEDLPDKPGMPQKLWKLPLGNPIVSISIDESEDEDQCEEIKKILEPPPHGPRKCGLLQNWTGLFQLALDHPARRTFEGGWLRTRIAGSWSSGRRSSAPHDRPDCGIAAYLLSTQRNEEGDSGVGASPRPIADCSRTRVCPQLDNASTRVCSLVTTMNRAGFD